jgi:outer membrane cobalamin receptor
MKKAVLFLSLILMLQGAALAQTKEVFLSLTKYAEDMDKLPTNVTIISNEEIVDSRSETLGEVLESQVGITLKSNGSIGQADSIFIRGSKSEGTLVLIDGRRINSIGLGGADFANISINIIDRIEIIRGAGASIYGTGAFGGVVNIITKKAQSSSPLADAGYSFGSYNTTDYFVDGAYRSDRFGILISGAQIDSNGMKNPNLNTGFHSQNAFLSAQGYINENSNLSLTGSIYDSTLGIPGTKYYETPYNKQQDDKKYVKLDYNQIVFEDFSIKVSGYGSRDIRVYSDYTYNPYDYSAGASRYKYVSDTFGAQADIHYKDIFLVGVERWQENYSQKEEISISSFSDSRINSAVYSQLNIEFWKLRFIPSARGDRNSVFGDVFTPAVSIIFNANENFKVSGNASKVWRAPAFDDLYHYEPYSMIGNPDLIPETGKSYDFGAQYTKDRLMLNGSYFYIESENLISWAAIDPNDSWSAWTPKNIDKAKQQGIELEAGFIINSWLKHSANYTYIEAVNESNGDINKGKILVYRPKHTINYSLTIEPVKKLSITANVSYRSSVFADAANTTENELSYPILLDMHAGYKINNSVNLWIKGKNLGNAKYEDAQYYPMPRLSIYAGITVSLWK